MEGDTHSFRPVQYKVLYFLKKLIKKWYDNRFFQNNHWKKCNLVFRLKHRSGSRKAGKVVWM
jgi:uncharacterized protein YqgQ